MTPIDAPRTLALAFGLLVALATAAARPVFSEQAAAPSPPKGETEGINAPFADPDVAAFVKRFESESREVYARRAEIVSALGLGRGMSVADVGAGTGVFTREIAREVGPSGLVYAVDIAPAFLRHVEEQSRRLGQSQVRTVRASQTTTGLKPESVDLAFLCDTYHHVEHPAAYLRSVHEALKPGGRLVVIDFDRVPGKSPEFVLKHVRAEKSVFVKEIEGAGFALVSDREAPKLAENFFLQFRKVSRPAGK